MNTNSEKTPPTDDSGGTAPAGSRIEQMEAENAALRARVDGNRPTPTGSHTRRAFAWIFAILAIILISASVTVGWAKTTLLDTESFVSTLAPLPRDPAVAEAISSRIGTGVVEATGLESSIAARLPDELVFISGPVASATGNLVATTANEIIFVGAVELIAGPRELESDEPAVEAMEEIEAD